MNVRKLLLTSLAAVALAAAATASFADTNDPTIANDPTINSDPAIIRGQDATQPYSFIVSTQKDGKPHCGGVLIEPQWVLTAAHCADTQLVRIGSLLTGSGGETINVLKTFRNPDFRPHVNEVKDASGRVITPGKQGSISQDIALVRLAMPSTQTPVRIGPQPPIGDPVRALGWGKTCEDRPACKETPGTGTLQQLDTVIADVSECSDFDSVFQLCVAPASNGGQTCNGDSGGPLLASRNGGLQLAGIITGDGSDPTKCADGTARVEDVNIHEEWITGTINRNGGPGA